MIDLKIFESLPGNSVVLLPDTPKFTVIAVSNDFINTTGIKRNELTGQGLFNQFPKNPDDPHFNGEQNIRASFDYVLIHKEPHLLSQIRYDLANGDGTFTVKYWKVHNVPVLDNNGEVMYIIHTSEDVTALVKAEQKEKGLTGIEKAYNLFMNAPVIIGILQGEHYIIELANEGLLEVWGRTDDVIGKPLLTAIPELEEQGFIALLDRVRTTGEPFYAYEFPITLNRGGKEEVLYFDFVYKPIYNDGGTDIASGVISVGHDVTVQVKARQKEQESEAKYRSLFESMDQGFCVLEMIFDQNNHPIDYRFLEINPVFEKQTGLKNAVGQTARELVPHLEALWFELYGKVALTGIPTRFIEGSEAMGRWFNVNAFKIGDSDSRKVALLFTDISEQKKAEEAIKQSEQNLLNTILQAPVAMGILRGPQFIVEIANERMYELWGRGKEELLGKSIFEGLPEVRNQGYEELLNGVFETGKTFAAQGIAVTLPRNGCIETVYINLLYEAFREANGRISGVIAVATDVSDQVRSKRILEESEAILQKRVAERTEELEQQKVLVESILEASLDGIYALKAIRDADGVITDFQYLFANHQVAKTLHLEAIQVIGAFMLELIPENRANGFFDLFCNLLHSGETLRGETHFVTQNIANWYEYVIVPIDGETVVVSTKNITDNKLSGIRIEEQRNLLDNILKNSSNGISVTEMIRNDRGEVVDVRTILVNNAAIKLTGLPKEIYLSKTALELDPHMLQSDYGQTCLRTLATGVPELYPYFLEPSGTWLEFSISKMDDDHLIHIFTDVTPVKEAQLQLERLVEELKRSNQNLEEFAYAASHDLKEPIRKVKFFSDRLKRSLVDRLTEEEVHSFERMETAAQRMGTLIEDLLSYSQISVSPSNTQEVDLNLLLEGVLSDLDLEIEEKGAQVRVEKCGTLLGNHRQLQQAFHNLIGNALKYNKSGVVPEIHVRCKQVLGSEAGLPLSPIDLQKKFYLITVSDNGIGFEQKDAERIFNVFTRLHGLTEYKGTGIGLSIVRKAIENHHGYIWAESKVGEGATFKILLPCTTR